MQFSLIHFGIAASLTALAAAGCKSSSQGSHAASVSPANAFDTSPELSKAPEPAEWGPMKSEKLSVDNFEMDLFPRLELAQHMIPGTDANHVPPQLQGIWWMDGNPLGVGDVFSFAESKWDLENHRVLFQEYGPNNLTVAGDAAGLKGFDQVAQENLSLVFRFNNDYSFAQLDQFNRVPIINKAIPIWEALIDYKLVQDPNDKNTYVRQTWGVGVRIGDYYFRRILDANLNPVEPYYTQWVNLKGAPDKFYLAKRKK